MSTRLPALLAALLFMLLPLGAAAQTAEARAELRTLQDALALINAEIRADLDQLMALHEVLKSNARAAQDGPPRSPDPVSYDAAQTASRAAIQRDAALSRRMEAILARNAARDAEKQPIVERIRALGLTWPASAAGWVDLPK